MSSTNNAKIGDLVWIDENGNGLQDTGEIGLIGVTVQLLDKTGKIIKTTTTDAKGNYSFSVAAGTYSLAIVAPTGYKLTTQDEQSDDCDSKDSDFDTTTFRTATFKVSAGQLKNTLDAGLIKIGGTPGAAPSVSISTDANNDGYINALELGNANTIAVKITFPVGAIAGDKITLTNGSSVTVISLSANDISMGYLQTTVPKPAEGTTLKLSATYTNSSGIASAAGTDCAVLDTIGYSSAPIVTITTDSNNDGIVNQSELGSASTFAVKVDLPAEVKAGDQITLTAGTNVTTRSLTATEVSSRLVTTTVAKPAEGATLTVKAILTDVAGNRSSEGSDAAQLSTGTGIGPAKPSVSISNDSNNDGLLSSSEINGAKFIDVVVSLPAGTQIGDKITITNQDNQANSKIVDATDLAAQKITFAGVFWIGVPGSSINVSATVTNALGKVSPADTDSVIIGSPDVKLNAPCVTLVTDSNNDGVINAQELGNSPTIAVKISLPTGTKAGDVLTINDGVNPPVQHPVTPAEASSGVVNVSIPKPVEGATLTVDATLTDANGNTSPKGSDSAFMDTTATVAPSVIITQDTNNDGVISAQELGAATQVSVQIGIPTGAKVGDTLKLTDGTTPQSKVLTAADLQAGVWNTQVAKPAEGNSVTVTATLTDKAGNVSQPGSDSAKLVTAPLNAPGVTLLPDSNNDGIINAQELGNSPTIAVKISLPTGTKAGDLLTVNDGVNPPVQHPVTPAEASSGVVNVSASKPAEGATLTVDATLTNANGNISPKGSDSALLDTTSTVAPTVIITQDTNNDGVISAQELGAATQVSVKVGIPTGAKVGDTLKLTDGTTAQSKVLTTADLQAGVWNTQVAKPAEGNTVKVTVTLTDKAGNVSLSGSDSAILDTKAPNAPTVILPTDANNDGVITAAELNGAPTLPVQIGLPTDAKAGDKLTVDDGINPPKTITLQPADITAGKVNTTVPTPVDGTNLTVKATLTDPAGNTSAPGSDSALLNNRTVATPTIVITTDANNDGLINKAELAGGKVGVQVTLPTDAKAGDTLKVNDNAGNVASKALQAADITAGKVSFANVFPAPAEGATITTTAQIITSSGQVSPSNTDSAVLDTVAPSIPVVTITTDDNNDAQISKPELTAHNGKIDVKVDLPQVAKAGDTVTVGDGTNPPVSKVLTPADITTKAVTFPGAFPAPADGQTKTVTAQLTDPAGNSSPIAQDAALLDTSAPTLQVNIDTDKNNDGTITRTELAGATRVDVSIPLPTGAKAGDKVDVTDNVGNSTNKVLSPDDIAAQKVVFTNAFPLPASGATITVAAQLTDAIGNKSPLATDKAVFDGNYPPVAVDDTNQVTGFSTPVTGSVLLNDTDPDGLVSNLKVSGVANTNTVKPGVGINAAIEGTYGHLTVHADGSYSYIADKSISITSAVEDNFYYLNQDGNGANTLSPAKLSITVKPAVAMITAITNPSVIEGSNLDFSITTTVSASATPVTLKMDGITATLGQDVGSMQVNFGTGWQNVIGGVVNEPAGTSSFQVRVPTIDDTSIEAAETLKLTATTSGNSVAGIGTILDNEVISGSALGQEDTPLTLKWQDFNLNNVQNVIPTVTIDSLPNNGVLKLNTLPVTSGQLISKADIDAGKLQFIPAANESGIDAYNSPGVGNMKNDYAQFKYSAQDSNGAVFSGGKLNIDIAPIADKGDLTIGVDCWLTRNNDGVNTIPMNDGLLLPWQAFESYQFPVTGSSPDTDGSEHLMVGFSFKATTIPLTANNTPLVMRGDHTYVTPDSNGMYWYPVNTPLWVQFGSRWDADYALYNQEVTKDGTVLNSVKIDHGRLDGYGSGPEWSGQGGFGGVIGFHQISPLVLDLNNDGIQTSAITAGTTFDLNADGQSEHTGWVSPQDGLLALDINGDGKIDSGAELFGDATQLPDGSRATDGFNALANYDSNHDGVIDATDPIFSQLLVWQDANSDGVSDASELKGLSAFNINTLNVSATENHVNQNGNDLALHSTFTTTDGAAHEMIDVWFETWAGYGIQTVQAPVETAYTPISVVGTHEGLGPQALFG